jgi:hypothetical protein
MVIPESQRAALVKGGALTPEADPDVWVVPELAWRHALLALVRHTPARAAGAPLRTRLTVPAFHRLWNRILADPGSVMHIGLPCTPLVPPDMPLVYECMDSTLGDLGRGHYRRASRRPCIVNCQSGRILDGLRAAWSGHAVRWELFEETLKELLGAQVPSCSSFDNGIDDVCFAILDHFVSPFLLLPYFPILSGSLTRCINHEKSKKTI